VLCHELPRNPIPVSERKLSHRQRAPEGGYL
jgi:hypothetical protein